MRLTVQNLLLLFLIRSDMDARDRFIWALKQDKKLIMKNKRCLFRSIPSCHLPVDAEVNMICLMYSLWQSHVRETPTACTVCLQHPQVSLPAPLVCCLHPSCGSCQSHTLWHANCHGDMCVTASESLFIGVRHAVRPAWSACDRALIKGLQDSKIDTTHSLSLSFSLSGLCAVSYIMFVTLWSVHNDLHWNS